MAKKKKTKKQKIEIRQKRLLKQTLKPSQEAISKREPIENKKPLPEKKIDKREFLYDFTPIKKDLIKSLLITLGIISLEFVLYLKLQ